MTHSGMSRAEFSVTTKYFQPMTQCARLGLWTSSKGENFISILGINTHTLTCGLMPNRDMTQQHGIDKRAMRVPTKMSSGSV